MIDCVSLPDPREASSPWYARWSAPLLNDPRDVVMVALMMQCGALAVAGVGLFLAGSWFWWLVPIYGVALFAGLVDRFTLMLHCTSHRQLFKPRYALANQIIPWVLAPFLGQTPETYFAHHMGMHHVEENLPDDLSSTMRFHRDRLGDWLQYWGRFMTVGVLDLSRYFSRRGKRKLLRRIVVGEGVYWTSMVVLLAVNPAATFVVFLLPLLVMRTSMMAGHRPSTLSLSRATRPIHCAPASPAWAPATTGAASTTATTPCITSSPAATGPSTRPSSSATSPSTSRTTPLSSRAWTSSRSGSCS